ncbi:hypothetical protein CSKR_107332 [Clonorchis sinensis]|uniref:Uncharacterized protein n=1 Tax=Clonorchis sinensis TaxID=79923 RepID=A0A3R7CIK3_CLOSI|nr:hypothetical protein CSKR_107332 [Clonorchis sinensis]
MSLFVVAGNGPSGRKGTVESRKGLVAGVLSNWVWQCHAITALPYFGFRTAPGREGAVESRKGTFADVLSNWLWKRHVIIGLTYFGFWTAPYRTSYLRSSGLVVCVLMSASWDDCRPDTRMRRINGFSVMEMSLRRSHFPIDNTGKSDELITTFLELL